VKVVVDTNILFSSLLAESSRLRDMLIESGYQFYAPNYLFVELFRYKDKIKKVGKLQEDTLLLYLQMVLEKIQFVQHNLISDTNRQQAYDLCKDIDVKDTVFVALCLELDAQLWTGDKKLKNHLLHKNFNQIFEY
jgi:predicted nucleic acid-binding protein